MSNFYPHSEPLSATSVSKQPCEVYLPGGGGKYGGLGANSENLRCFFFTAKIPKFPHDFRVGNLR